MLLQSARSQSAAALARARRGLMKQRHGWLSFLEGGRRSESPRAETGWLACASHHAAVLCGTREARRAVGHGQERRVEPFPAAPRVKPRIAGRAAGRTAGPFRPSRAAAPRPTTQRRATGAARARHASSASSPASLHRSHTRSDPALRLPPCRHQSDTRAPSEQGRSTNARCRLAAQQSHDRRRTIARRPPALEPANSPAPNDSTRSRCQPSPPAPPCLVLRRRKERKCFPVRSVLGTMKGCAASVFHDRCRFEPHSHRAMSVVSCGSRRRRLSRPALCDRPGARPDQPAA